MGENVRSVTSVLWARFVFFRNLGCRDAFICGGCCIEFIIVVTLGNGEANSSSYKRIFHEGSHKLTMYMRSQITN